MFAFALVTCVMGIADDAPKLDGPTLAALRKKLAGKTTWDRQTGMIQVAYDFSAAKQGNDFLIDEKPATKVKGVLALKGAAEATHVVPWRTVEVECAVFLTKVGGPLLKAEQSKVMFYLTMGSGGGAAVVEVPGHGMGTALKKTDLSGLRTIRFEHTESSCSGSFAAAAIRKQEIQGPPGRIVFTGGTNGYEFRMVAFRGRPDPDWLKGLVEKKSK